MLDSSKKYIRPCGFRLNVEELGVEPKIGNVSTEIPTNISLGTTIEKNNLTFYNQWNFFSKSITLMDKESNTNIKIFRFKDWIF